MFMRYWGGGIGHKYMQKVEATYENMSRERSHGKQLRREPGTPQASNEDAHGSGDEPEDDAHNDGEEPMDYAHNDGNESMDDAHNSSDEPENTMQTGASNIDGDNSELDEAEDEDCELSEGSSGGDEGEYSDEVASEGDGYDSYGLAEP